jgi:hypothetical protein
VKQHLRQRSPSLVRAFSHSISGLSVTESVTCNRAGYIRPSRIPAGNCGRDTSVHGALTEPPGRASPAEARSAGQCRCCESGGALTDVLDLELSNQPTPATKMKTPAHHAQRFDFASGSHFGQLMGKPFPRRFRPPCHLPRARGCADTSRALVPRNEPRAAALSFAECSPYLCLPGLGALSPISIGSYRSPRHEQAIGVVAAPWPRRPITRGLCPPKGTARATRNQSGYK